MVVAVFDGVAENPNPKLFGDRQINRADFFRCIGMIKDRLGAKPLVMQVPIGIEASLKGVVDLIKMKAVIWKNEDLGAAWELTDIPDDLKISTKYRQELVETAVEQDEKLMEDYLMEIFQRKI